MKFKRVWGAGVALVVILGAAAPAVAGGTATVCDYVKAAIADAPNNFANITVNESVKLAYFPTDASNCGGGEVQPGAFASACFWVLSDRNEATAKLRLAALNQAVTECVGPDYGTQPETSGGLVFVDHANRGRLKTRMFRDDDGLYEVYVTIAGPGASFR